jgi:RNA polymerase sigma-B factor
MTEQQVCELIAKYRETKDVRLRNRIAEHYLYIADILAKKFVGRGVEYDDLKQVASYSLLRGIDRFDPEKGVKFSTFITTTITGEIKNYFRDKSRVIKLPRALAKIGAQVREFVGRYEAENGVKPTVKVIAGALNLPEEKVLQGLELGGTLSLDTLKKTDDDGAASLYTFLPDKDDQYDKMEETDALSRAISTLTDTEKQIVELRYQKELSQNETAQRLGVSQMFVSRSERKILQKMKEQLAGSV